jgi:antitoxin component YwqK of YwqJK toxin-antitoxin module
MGRFKVYTIEKGVFIAKDKTEFMFLTLHRDPKDGPAYTSYYDKNTIRSIEYWYNRKKHRDNDLPATIKYYPNGNIKSEEYLTLGILHRVGNPAVITYYENGQKQHEEFWYDNNRHNLSGPAIIEYDLNAQITKKTYIVNFKTLTEDEFKKIVLKEKLNIL